MSERNLKKMTPQGAFAPVADAVKEKKEEAADALEKAKDRAERKLRNGASIIQKPDHH